jgi:hypothetical protein
MPLTLTSVHEEISQAISKFTRDTSDEGAEKTTCCVCIFGREEIQMVPKSNIFRQKNGRSKRKSNGVDCDEGRISTLSTLVIESMRCRSLA